MSESIIARLHDLHHQATQERSHYYVGKCVGDAIAEIERLREALIAAREKLRIELGGAREYKGGMPTQVLFPLIDAALKETAP